MNSESNINLTRFTERDHGHLIVALTHLLHEAYAPLAAKGMKYLATHQPPTKTLERLLDGESYLAFLDTTLIGTVTLYSEDLQSTCEYYRKPGVYSFGQFAIHPTVQGKGYGSAIMEKLETRAKELGASELALDTSEHAADLISRYEKRGYLAVAHTKWEVTNYHSVVMAKKLE